MIYFLDFNTAKLGTLEQYLLLYTVSAVKSAVENMFRSEQFLKK